MRRRYKIYRGDQLLGYVGFDDEWPCEPFEPAADFHPLQSLFQQEYDLVTRAAELSDPDEVDAILAEADKVMDEIVEPGIRLEALEAILCSFECDQLSIFNGRVCWR